MKQELNRLVRLAGCSVLLCGSVILAEDAAPAAPAAPATPAAPAASAKREGGQEAKDLKAQIAAKEKAILEKNADLKKEIDALDAQIKAKRETGTPEARKQARELTKQRQEKLAAVDPELKDLYAKLNDTTRQPFGGGKGQGRAKRGAKPAAKPAAE